MEYAEVLSPPEKAAADLRKVSPESLPLPAVRCASAPLGPFILFSTLFHDERREKDVCTVRRFDPSDSAWKVLHEEVLDMPALGGSITDIAPLTGIRLMPDVRGEVAAAEVWWELRGGLRRWSANAADFSDEAQPQAAKGGTPGRLPLADARLNFLSWRVWDGGLVALVEDSRESRRLVRKRAGGSDWEPVTGPNEGGQVSAFAIFDEALHVTVDDARRGFSLWKLSSADGPAGAESWKPVLKLGAFRYLLNANVLDLVASQDALYLAAGLREALPVDRSVGAVARHDFELLRVYPGGVEWDVVIGQPRFTPDGLKAPLSGRGPGFYEREPLQAAYLASSASGLHLGMTDAQMPQLWRQDAADNWHEAAHGAFIEYQRVRITAAHPTPHGILLITECLDFGGNDKVELWMLPESAS